MSLAAEVLSKLCAITLAHETTQQYNRRSLEPIPACDFNLAIQCPCGNNSYDICSSSFTSCPAVLSSKPGPTTAKLTDHSKDTLGLKKKKLA
jgi:hypothetical protein